MNTLFFDIASHKGLVACCTEDRVASVHVCKDRVGDRELIPLVEEVLHQADWKHEDLTHIACIHGPGGFTGLRVSATYINVLADQLGIPSAGIHMSDFCKAKAEEDCLWLHSTKKTELFVRGFGAYASLWPEPVLIELDKLIEMFPKEAQWAGELLSEHEEAIGAIPVTEKDAEDVLPAFLSDCIYNNSLVLPWYGRGW